MSELFAIMISAVCVVSVFYIMIKFLKGVFEL
jgi:hypothetical protein